MTSLVLAVFVLDRQTEEQSFDLIRSMARRGSAKVTSLQDRVLAELATMLDMVEYK